MALVLLSREGPVAHLRLNRPERHNAQTPALWNELIRLSAELLADDSVRCLVLAGEGPSFSSGLDRTALAAGEITPASLTGRAEDAGRTRFETDDLLLIQRAFRWLSDAPFVTVAAVHGYALGAGAQLALACDIRVLAEGAQLGLPEAELGMMPDVGGITSLTRLVGYSRALELALTGERIDAERAVRLGLANSVVPPAELLPTVTALAATLAGRAGPAVRYSKLAARAAAEGDTDRSYLLAAQGADALGRERTRSSA